MAGRADPIGYPEARRRMLHRDGVDTLPAHLERTCGIDIAGVTELDAGVYRVNRAGRDTPLIARLFRADRPHRDAEADLAVLHHLAERGFPAERPHGTRPLSRHRGQSVLVTGFVRAVPRDRWPSHPIIRLGATIGALHGIPVPPGADRPAGALHHHADGTLADELAAAIGWLDDLPPGAGIDALRDALAAADGGTGLPDGFVHPDPVPGNVVQTSGGPVLIDWAGAGRGPRLASLTMILKSGWAAGPFLNGYTRRVTLTDEERDRLPGLRYARVLIGLTERVCLDPLKAPAAAANAARRLTTLRRANDTAVADTLTYVHPTDRSAP